MRAAALAACIAWTGAARAKPVKLDPVVVGPGGAAPEVLTPLLQRGDLALLENHPGGALKQTSTFSLIPAECPRVFERIADPSQYPAWIKNVPVAEVLKREGQRIEYRYEIQAPLQNVEMVQVMRLSPPDAIHVEALDRGDVRTLSMDWRFQPWKDQCLVISTMYANIRESGWVVRQILKVEPNLEHGINVAAAIMNLQGLRRGVGGKAAPDPAAKGAAEKQKISVQSMLPDNPVSMLSGLAPLLKRGTLVLVESWPTGGLKQVGILASSRAGPDSLWEVVADHGGYPAFLPNVKHQKVRDRVGDRAYEMESEFGVLFISVPFRSKVLLDPPRRVSQKPYSGNIRNALWIWDVHPAEPGSAMCYSYYTDLRDSSDILRKFLQLEPSFEHGLNIAAGIVAMRGMIAESERRAGLSPKGGKSP
ncbi:MAG: hypothetical protein GMKNLPBB_03031 [Myxococcota bacterium]|nr:hypothetical protein [Myxococcota bacterium]